MAIRATLTPHHSQPGFFIDNPVPSPNYYHFTKSIMIKLYGIRMGSSLRNHWMLCELDVPYEEVPVDLRAREHKQEAFLQLNPSGQVPVLADDDFILCESMAINSYLAEKFKPEFLGTTIRERAIAWRWSIWSYLNIQKHFGTIWYQSVLAPEKDQSAIDKAVTEIKPYLAILDKYLSDKKHLTGELFSVADINAGVAIGYGVSANFDLSEFPNISRWFELISSPPAPARRQPPSLFPPFDIKKFDLNI